MPVKIADQVGPVLPSLRRYARAISGSQASGDTYVRVMLETLIADPHMGNSADGSRLGVFRLFHTVWAAVGQEIPSAAPDSDGQIRVADERLARLAPASRQALLLTAMEGFSLDETAAILGVERAAVEAYLKEADTDIQAMTRATVLIIEDEPIIAFDIQGLVEDLGHRVVGVCATRREAVAAAAESRPDLVLADIQLADGSSGVDAAADILGLFDVPIVFITAFPDRLLTGRQVEPTFLITKPFQAAAVRAAISQALFFRENAKKLR